MSTNNSESTVTWVAYQIVFNKYDYEAILEDGKARIVDVTPSFASEKIAKFVRRMDKEGIELPTEWDKHDVRRLKLQLVGAKGPNGRELFRLSSDDLEYLQVLQQELETSNRRSPNYDDDKIDALRDIEHAIRDRWDSRPSRPTVE